MDIVMGLKLLASIGGVIAVGKIIYDISIGKKSRLRDEYKFAKTFLDDIEEKALHPFALEKGYQAIAGTKSVNSIEVSYILSLEKPSQCLKDFVLSRSYLEDLETKENPKIAFKKKFSSPCSRSWRKGMYLLGYFTLSFLAISPLLIKDYVTYSSSETLLQLLFSLPICGIYAWLFIYSFSEIFRGEKLVENQMVHKEQVKK